MIKRHTVLLVSSIMLTSLYGCSSDNREVATGTASYQKSSGCISCHGGFGNNSTSTKYSPVTGAKITDEWQKSAHNTSNGAACTDCHTNSGHPSGGSIVKAVQDTQCATCHTTTSLGILHFANFTTSLASQFVSQSDPAGVQCRKCHNPHDTTSLIQYNKDWAESGHGETTFSNDGNANNDSVNSHYPWTTSSRDSCSKCHTTTGNLMHTVGGATTLTNNSFNTNPASVVSTTTVTGGPLMSNNKKNETVMCSACHADYSWKRRDIGARTLEYTYDPDFVPGGGSDAFAGAAPASTDGATAATAVQLPDAGDSNLCLVCHSGRGNFQSKRSTRFEGHHAPTGADLYAEYTHVGYEFAGLDYTKPGSFAHSTIGIADGSGPCVSCHMKSTNSHTFEAVNKDGNGVITAIKSQAICNDCHDTSMTAAILEGKALGYKDAGKLLKDYLANTVTNYTNAAITVSSSNVYTIHVNTYGAFQNSLYPTEDPGGFAHNSYYVKRLIFDSIDWLDNHAFDGTITINATNYPDAAKWYGAPDGTTGDYTASRP